MDYPACRQAACMTDVGQVLHSTAAGKATCIASSDCASSSTLLKFTA